MEHITLNNGIRMPMLGYGTFQIDPAKTEECVSQAIAAGYRLIDTAQGYFNEQGVGSAVQKSGVPREEFFLTTKIWISNGGYEKARHSIDESLGRLQTDYIDLCLIHQAFNDYYGTYRAMEEAYHAGKIRAIGVSNFSMNRFIDLANFAEVIPAVNQLEVHAFCQQKQMRKVLKKYGTQLMAWSPLAQGRAELLENKQILSIGEQHHKTAAQISLRFLLQSGIAAIPKTVHRERMIENLELFDFKLTSEEVRQLRTLDRRKSMFIDFCSPEVAEMFVKAGQCTDG